MIYVTISSYRVVLYGLWNHDWTMQHLLCRSKQKSGKAHRNRKYLCKRATLEQNKCAAWRHLKHNESVFVTAYDSSRMRGLHQSVAQGQINAV